MAKLPERMMARSGTFYCRIWVPSDMAPIYGRQLVVRSLHTKDLKTAKSRLARKSVELETSLTRFVPISPMTILLPVDLLTLLRMWWKDGHRQGVLHRDGWLFPGQHAMKPISTRQL